VHNVIVFLRRFRWYVAAVTILVIAATITLSVTGKPGPSVNFSAGGVYYGGALANPGRVADFSAVLESSSAARITVLGVSLVPLPGFATPKLVHVALLTNSRDYPAGTTGWPPRSGVGTGVYPTRAAIGAQINIGMRQLPIIVYGVTGSKSGRLYAVAGINVRFRVDGVTDTALVLAGGFDCVQSFSSAATHTEMKWCNRHYAVADSKQWNLPAAKAMYKR
jgi:hypothetical protein